MRVKFQSKKQQREFFLSVKKSTKMGSRKLSKLLGLKSRGGLESYISCRTSPELSLVQKLEEVSGIKGNYEVIAKNKLIFNKRKFTPMEINEAKKSLTKFSAEKYEEIIQMIKNGERQEDILKMLRNAGYKFDNASVGRAIGTIRINSRVRLVGKIDKTDCILLSGISQRGPRGLSVTFNVGPVNKELHGKKIGVQIENLNIKICPLINGRKLFSVGKGRMGFQLPSTIKIEHNSKVNIFINLDEFGFSIFDSIQDNDARTLLKAALKNDFTLYPKRSTTGNLMGDLVLNYKKRTILIEITRAKRDQAANWKLGQSLLQKLKYPEFENFIVVRKSLLRKSHLNALDHIGTKYIFTDFGDDWEEKVMQEIKNKVNS